MSDEVTLPERLRMHRVILKSGEYDGAQLMQAWCAMIDAAEAIEAHEAALTAARDQGYNEGIEAAARYIQDQYPHDKRVLVPVIRKLKGQADDAE